MSSSTKSIDAAFDRAPPPKPRSDDFPVLVIEPRAGWRSLELAELWRYRYLLYSFLWRDIKAGQKQTVLGMAWLFISPLISVAVFTVVFGKLANISFGDIPYPLGVFAGHVLWNAFGPAVQSATQSVVANAHFIHKVYFPRLLIPTSAALAGVVNLSIVFTSMFAVMLWFGRTPTWTVLLGIPLALAVLATALGVALWLAPLNVIYRDIGFLTNYIVQLGFYLTPVVYPVSLIPGHYRWLLAINPLAGYIDTFRWCLFGGEIAWDLFIPSLITTTLLFISGAFFFTRMQGRFADVI